MRERVSIPLVNSLLVGARGWLVPLVVVLDKFKKSGLVVGLWLLQRRRRKTQKNEAAVGIPAGCHGKSRAKTEEPARSLARMWRCGKACGGEEAEGGLAWKVDSSCEMCPMALIMLDPSSWILLSLLFSDTALEWSE